MKNEERKTKNWGSLADAGKPNTLSGECECFMSYHKAFGNACGCRGLQGNAEAIPVLRS